MRVLYSKSGDTKSSKENGLKIITNKCKSQEKLYIKSGIRYMELLPVYYAHKVM